ncbi:MAG: hemerythrin domain-containing protein [Comamonas sp.]
MTSRVALPGLRSPGAGFDQPFEMLSACHERVQRTLDLLQRLQAYLAEKGVDDSARQAARDVLRYFDVAAPLHHEDEELHIFPPLLQTGTDAATLAVVHQLQQDHLAMAACWAQARQPLLALASGAQDAFSIADQALLQSFAGLYADHIRHEEGHIYPAAQQVVDAAAQQAMGREMAARRGG